MKVYTKTGDQGTTSLFTGERVLKDSLRVEVYGTVDELNSTLGLARSQCQLEEVKGTILELQKMLMSLMADLASLNPQEWLINPEHISVLERKIDQGEAELPPLRQFIIPGDNLAAAYLDVARTVTRRAERALWRLSREEAVEPHHLIFLNRLSDLCFILERLELQKK